ncbi:MAG: DNRLRE domain-containing protein, partial [Lachnospiraceae bacterium]|nr:DNRLRE domain-containing protein [Lachnospiraceae bacterium]
LKILSQENGIVRVEIEADRDWLQDENRVYPVKIDPYVNETVRNFEYDASALYIKDTYPYGTLCVGNDQGASYGKMKSYVKFGLPTLSAGDVVTGGYLHLAKYAGEAGYSHVGNPNLQINVYRVTSTWSESSVKASSGYSGLPSINSTVVDYQIVHAESEAEWVTFDVSKVVKAWYEGTANYGLCLRANDQDAWAFAKFVASDNSAYASARPTLQVTYRNNKGLENYWTTHDQSLGESGCGYVNDYTGNLVYIAPLLSTTGNRMPVSLSLIYNGYQHGSNVDRTNTVGKGWRLNIQERITPITNSGGLNSKLYERGFRYAYDDADGTTHYFKADSNNSGKFVDEDGMGLTLTVNSTVTDSEKYTVTADTGGKMTFMPSGQLRKVYDDNGNYYKIFYDDSTLRISRIVDGAGRTITIDSNSNGRITSITDPAGRVVTFVYSSDWDGLRRIEYSDGTKTQFYYTDSGAKLRDVYAINGSHIHYEYPTTGDSATKGRVTGIAEYGSNGAAGNSLTISYAGMNRTRFTDNRGRSETYQFDNWGKTICIFDAAGNGSRYIYSNTSDKTANALKSIGVATKFTENRLINHNFENNLSNWAYPSGKVSTDSAHYYYGTKSEKLSPEGYVSQMVSKDPSYTYYTSSVYARGSSNASRLRLSIYFY